MTINRITQDQYDKLLRIQKEFPNLSFQNVGYTYPNKNEWSEEDLNAHKIVSEILSKSVVGFKEFNHFKLDSLNRLSIRFQWDWNVEEEGKIPFIGVGYLSLDELLNGVITRIKYDR